MGIHYQNISWENNLLAVGLIKLAKNILLCDSVFVMNEESGSFTRCCLLYKELKITLYCVI